MPRTPRIPDRTTVQAGKQIRDRFIRRYAWAAREALIQRGASLYLRSRDLPRLLPALAWDIAQDSALEGVIVARLRRALAQERALGGAGHWTYNLGRHMALAQALRAEEALATGTNRNAAPRDGVCAKIRRRNGTPNG